ncbi:transglutaminase family protein [Patescibacteria group bacterium]|nr:transglutaminase family protein [Patescibacteria group bacterium]
MNQDLSEFLKETRYCDWKNPEIIKVVENYKAQFTDRRELAIKLFEFVRDEIKYRIGPWGIKSSDTLRERKGMCTSSSNLLVALYRAANIPSGYCIYKVRGGESFGHILPALIKNPLKKHSVHIICYVYLDKWIKCDSSTDRDLSHETRHISNIMKLVEWNGKDDFVHEIDQEHIINISDPLANIDYQLDKKPRYIVRKYIFRIGNYYIDFLRVEGKKIKSHVDIEKKFTDWMKNNKKFLYYNYKIAYYAYNIKFKVSKSIKKSWEKKRIS